MDLSPETLRAHFWTLTGQAETLEAKLIPLRAKLDKEAGRDMTASAEGKLRDQIKALQQELAPIENQRAAAARALGGMTGERPA